MNEGVYLGPYIALKPVTIPQGPGTIPAMLKLAVNKVFSFDGDEPIDINSLLQKQSIMPYTGDMEALEDKE